MCRYCNNREQSLDEYKITLLRDMGIDICDICWQNLSNQKVFNDVTSFLDNIEGHINFMYNDFKDYIYTKVCGYKGGMNDAYLKGIDNYKVATRMRNLVKKEFIEKDIDFLMALIDIEAVGNILTKKKMKELSGVPYWVINKFQHSPNFFKKENITDSLSKVRNFYAEYKAI